MPTEVISLRPLLACLALFLVGCAGPGCADAAAVRPTQVSAALHSHGPRWMILELEADGHLEVSGRDKSGSLDADVVLDPADLEPVWAALASARLEELPEEFGLKRSGAGPDSSYRKLAITLPSGEVSKRRNWIFKAELVEDDPELHDLVQRFDLAWDALLALAQDARPKESTPD